MRPQDKKTLRKLMEKLSALQSEFEELCDDHQSWMDDHDYGWEDTAAGERASDDQYNFEEWRDAIEQLSSDIDGEICG